MTEINIYDAQYKDNNLSTWMTPHYSGMWGDPLQSF